MGHPASGGSNVTAKRRVGGKYRRTAQIYAQFAQGFTGLDFSEAALQELFVYESTGRGTVGSRNGYAVGKRISDVTISSWKEDLFSTLWPQDLYEDESLPDWWLDKVLGPRIARYMAAYRRAESEGFFHVPV